jgi:hypothetical protein
MQNDFSTTEMRRWVNNFNSHTNLPFVTKSALINLSDLEAFIEKIKAQQADSVRIYFIRFSLNDTPTAKLKDKKGRLFKGCDWPEVANGLTQATIAMVPAKNFKIHEEDLVFSADDIILGDTMHTLLPGIDTKGTGLNPPSPSIDSNVME